MQVTTGSDVFSFGVLMWVFYAGQHPCLWSPAGAWVPNPAFPFFVPKGRSVEDPIHVHYIHLAHSCLHMDPHARPTFAEISERLSLILGPPEPTTPLPAPSCFGLEHLRATPAFKKLAAGAAAAAAADDTVAAISTASTGVSASMPMPLSQEVLEAASSSYLASRTLLASCLPHSGEAGQGLQGASRGQGAGPAGGQQGAYDFGGTVIIHPAHTNDQKLEWARAVGDTLIWAHTLISVLNETTAPS